jgi:hypothetical protein
MEDPIKIICGCGNTIEPDISIEFNYKDIVHCECGRVFLIVEIS